MNGHSDPVVVEDEDGQPLDGTDRMYGAIGMFLAGLLAIIVLIALVVAVVD